MVSVTSDPPDGEDWLGQACIDIAGRLRARSSDVIQAAYERILEVVPEQVDALSRDDRAGMVTAVTAIVEHSLECMESGSGWSVPIPEAAAAEARRGARAGVSLGVMMRRYLAAHGCLGEFIAREAEHAGLSPGPVLHYLRRNQDVLLQSLTAAIEIEYEAERERRERSPEQRRADTVQRLLADEPVGPAELAELDYELHGRWHLAMIVSGAGAWEALRKLEVDLGRRLLSVRRGEKMAWSWMGSERKPAGADLERLLPHGPLEGASLAVGEPNRGIGGWRLTHRQAQGALRVALRAPQRFARYEPFLAAAVQDDTLARSLSERYLAPLSGQRDGGATLRQTLRAYIDAHGSATSAARELRVRRHTVESRLHTAESLIDAPLYTCLAKIDVALRLVELDGGRGQAPDR
jgi:PucR C-terminal helix-turn-helix domain